jgi:O-antigen/teichoic acid export membrane protein
MTAESTAVPPTRRSLISGAAWMTVANGARLFLQAAYFIILARSLGVTEYGRFSAGLALVSVLAPFAAMGSGNVMVMHVARGTRPFADQWGKVLVAIPTFGFLLSIVVVALGSVIVPVVPVLLLATLCIAELGLSRLCDSAVQVFQAHEQARAMALLTLLPSAFRAVAAVAAALVLGHIDAVKWSELYLIATAFAALPAYVAVHARFGPPHLRMPSREEMVEGASFSAAQSSVSIYTDIDKALLARIGSLADTGAYTAAYRATAFAFVPIMSVFNASYARFFKAGTKGVIGSRGLAATLLPGMAAYALAAGAGLVLLAPVLSSVLGAGFGSTEPALRWLAILPLLQVFAYLAGDTLTGAGRQHARTITQGLTALLNVVLCFLLIPSLGWRGAAIATVVSFAFLGACLWMLVVSSSRIRTTAGRPLRVIAWPGPNQPARNPYLRLFYQALELSDDSVEVTSWPPAPTAFARADVWHIHWPDRAAYAGSLAGAVTKALAFVALISLAKVTGKKVVWTVHNIRGHDVPFPAIETVVIAWLARHVDATVNLSERARRDAEAAYPVLKGKPSLIVPHGHYIDAYPQATRNDARTHLKLDPDATVAALVGDIAPYKNAPQLIRIFKAVRAPSALLLIAGKPITADLRNEILAAARDDPRVVLHLHALSDSELVRCIAAADVVVLPYSGLLNSGMAMLALSFGRPILGPASGALIDLAKDFGSEWIQLYEDQLKAADLEAAMMRIKPQAANVIDPSTVLAEKYGWQRSGVAMAAFLRSLVS